jgi:hypothetical protein
MGECGAKKEFYWCIASKDGSELKFRHDLPQLTGLAFGAGHFMAVGKGVIMGSSDGFEWTKVDLPAGIDPTKGGQPWIVWTGTGFICGMGPSAITSPNGVKWKTENYTIPCRISYADAKAHLFLGSSWGGNIWTSHDAKKWDKAALGGNAINMLAVKPGP